MKNKNITFLGVPTHWGVGIKELAKGPASYREHGIIENLRGAGFNINDAGDIDCDSNKKAVITDPRMRYIDEVVKVSKLTSKKVEEIISSGRVPLVIGGDHSVEIGAISGAAKAFKGNIGVIYIDEHGDFTTDRYTDSGNIHGMSLSAVVGLGNKKIAAISGVPVKKENVLHIGGDQFETIEMEFIEAERIEAIKLTDIINDGMRPVINAIDRLSKKVDNIWVSLDIDSIDAQDAPGVTMPDRFGLTYREISNLARHIGKNNHVVGVTVAEYNLVNDQRGKTLELITELIASFLGGEYSWYRADWMNPATDKMLHHEILSEGGLLDQLLSSLKKNGVPAKELKEWGLKVGKFLETIANRKNTTENALPLKDFAQLIGFTKITLEKERESKRLDIFWRSSEEIKNETSLGVFQIDVTRLSQEDQRKLLDYFVKIIYRPLDMPKEQTELVRFLSLIRHEQHKAKGDLKIGILHSLSGTMAISETSLVDAALMAIDEINEQGGLLGKRIKPIIVDGASNPDRFATEALDLVTKQNVKSVFGGWTSASRKMMKPIIEDHNNLLWYSVQYEGLEESPNIIYNGATPNQQALPAVEWAMKNLGEKFFLVGSDYVYPRAVNKIITQKIEELGGSVADEEYQVLGSSDFKDIVKKIKKAKPDVILNTINGDSNIAFFKLLRLEGINSKEIPTISFSISEEEISDMDIKTVLGDYAVWNYFESIDSPTNKSFVERFKAKYGKERVVSDPIEASYTAVHLFAEAVKIAGSDDPMKIRMALKNVIFKAPEGTIKVDSRTQHVSRNARIGKIDIDGQFEIVWDSKTPVIAESYPKNLSIEQWNTFLDDLYVGWGKQWSKS